MTITQMRSELELPRRKYTNRGRHDDVSDGSSSVGLPRPPTLELLARSPA
jgi:hypothetical protein